jgi:AcrR family transcriptional regulator
MKGSPGEATPARSTPTPTSTPTPAKARVRKALTSTTTGGAPAQERKLRTQGRKTLRRLLDAAITVFERRGYHAARVDDIVKVAKTSHGTFYLYFANKEDLFRALLADVTDEMTALSQSLGPIGSSKAGYDELRAWLSRFFDLYEHYHPVIRAWTESEVGDPALSRLGVNVLGGLVQVLTVRISEVGPAVGIDPVVAATAAVAMVERFSYYVVSRNLGMDRGAALDTLTTMLHVGVFGGTRRRER